MDAAAKAAADAAYLEDFKQRWIEELGRRAAAAAKKSHSLHEGRVFKLNKGHSINTTKEQLANTVQTTFAAWRLIGFSTPSRERDAYISAHNALINN